jgi:hypothetical protein
MSPKVAVERMAPSYFSYALPGSSHSEIFHDFSPFFQENAGIVLHMRQLHSTFFPVYYSLITLQLHAADSIIK